MRAIGLDISTNKVGYGIINYDDLELIKYGCIDVSKQTDIFDKLLAVKKILLQIKNYNVDKVFIEDILNKFVSGKSTVKTIIKLAKFNALVSYECINILSREQIHLNVLHARKLAMGHSVPRGLNSKEYVLNKILEWYNDIILPKKKSGKYDSSAFDICDAILIARAGIMTWYY